MLFNKLKQKRAQIEFPPLVCVDNIPHVVSERISLKAPVLFSSTRDRNLAMFALLIALNPSQITYSATLTLF